MILLVRFTAGYYKCGKPIVLTMVPVELEATLDRDYISANDNVGHAVTLSRHVSDYWKNTCLRMMLPPDYRDTMFKFIEENSHIGADAEELLLLLSSVTLGQAMDAFDNTNLYENVE